MSNLAIFFWISNILLDTTGHMAFKSAAFTEHETDLQRWKIMLSSPMLWIGIVCFDILFGVWFALLSLIPLSLAMLIGSINIVVVMLAGRLLFQGSGHSIDNLSAVLRRAFCPATNYWRRVHRAWHYFSEFERVEALSCLTDCGRPPNGQPSPALARFPAYLRTLAQCWSHRTPAARVGRQKQKIIIITSCAKKSAK